MHLPVAVYLYPSALCNFRLPFQVKPLLSLSFAALHFFWQSPQLNSFLFQSTDASLFFISSLYRAHSDNKVNAFTHQVDSVA